METQEPEKIKELVSEQITTTVKQTVPKNPGRVAAGKKHAEHSKKAREAKKKAKEVSTQRGEQKEKQTQESSENKQREQSSSFSLTQVLSVASIEVSRAGLYYKREELKRLFKNESERSERSEKAQRELIDHMVEVEGQNISETKKLQN